MHTYMHIHITHMHTHTHTYTAMSTSTSTSTFTAILTVGRVSGGPHHLHPRVIVSHAKHPQHVTYAQALRVFQGTAPNGTVWVLHDVHLVDAALCELMAAMKMSPGTKVVLMSASREAARGWAVYIDPSSSNIPTTRVVSPPRWGGRVEYSPQASSAAEILAWVEQQQLQGCADILIFARTAAHRDELTRDLSMATGRWSTYTVEAIVTTPTPVSSNTIRRFLVGTPALDGALASPALARVQYVVDFGIVFYPRQDTVDWEEGYITETMAWNRRRVCRLPGACLCIYRNDGVLRKEPWATHNLRQDICRARLLTAYGPLAIHDFPIPLGPITLDTKVARIMSLLYVERGVAALIAHAPSVDVGIAVAAAVARHNGPFPYHGFLNPTSRRPVLRQWANALGRPYKKVAQSLHETSWTSLVVPLLGRAYEHTTAVAAGHRNLFIHTRTGEVLTWRYATADTKAVVYLHRTDKDLSSCIPIPFSGTMPTEAVVRAPVKLMHDVQVEAMEAWFEERNVVAWRVSDTHIGIAYYAKIHISTILTEWTAMQRQHALEMPFLVEIGHGMNLVMTAGGRFSDAVRDVDYCMVDVIAGSARHHLTKTELARLHETPGVAWCAPHKRSMLLAARSLTSTVRERMRHVYYTAWKYSGTGFRPSHVSLRLSIQMPTGKSTGRAVVVGNIPHHIPTEWTVHPGVDLLTPYTYKQNSDATTITDLPEHMDEIDIATRLGIDPAHVDLERTATLIARLPCIATFLRQTDPENLRPLPTRTRRGFADFSLYVEEKNLEETLRLLHDTVPRTSAAVNQPLRVEMVLAITKGSHSRPPATPKRILRLERQSWASDLACVQIQLGLAKQDAHDTTPSFVWLPALAAPWRQPTLPDVENDHGGPMFRLYGPASVRQANENALANIANKIPPEEEDYGTCPICMEPEAFFDLRVCGCRFCLACLATTFDLKCQDPRFVDEFVCPLCTERVGAQDLAMLVEPNSLKTYAVRKAAFVATRSPDILQSCPSQCGYFTNTVRDDMDCPVCDKAWCMACSHKLHTPVPVHKGFCQKQWDTDFWRNFATEASAAGARPCPQCGAFVVKDGGCNHLVCEAPRCGTHFCWKCAQAFSHVANSPPPKASLSLLGRRPSTSPWTRPRGKRPAILPRVQLSSTPSTLQAACY